MDVPVQYRQICQIQQKEKCTMIGSALKFTRDVLDQFLRNRFSLDESIVVLNNVVDSTGTSPVANQNKVVISLINIEKETARPFYNKTQKLANGSYSNITPSEKYNLDIMISANFDDYLETLKFLSAIIQFFQVNLCLDSGTSSNMPEGLNRLEFDIEKLTYHQMHSLWTAMGAKYQPSVIYKTRLITIQGNESDGISTQITKYANPVIP